MKKAVKLLVASMVAISATSAMAESGKGYFGIGAGLSRYHDWASQSDVTNLMNAYGATLGVDSFVGTQHADADNGVFGYRIFGGYPVYENIAAEISYIDMGKVEAYSQATGTFYDVVNNSVSGDLLVKTKAEVNAFTLDANMKFPLTSAAALNIKAGVYSADTRLSLQGGGSISSEDYYYSKTQSSTGIHYGLGVSLAITDTLDIRADWESLHGVKANDGKSDVSLLSGALVFSF